jgi:hypothetical protein
MTLEISLHDALFAVQTHLNDSDKQSFFLITARGNISPIIGASDKYYDTADAREIIEAKLEGGKAVYNYDEKQGVYEEYLFGKALEETEKPFHLRYNIGDKFIILKDISDCPLYRDLKLPIGYVTTVVHDTTDVEDRMNYCLSSEDFSDGLWVWNAMFKGHLESGAIALFKDVLKAGFEFYITDGEAWEELVGYGRYGLPEGKAFIERTHAPNIEGETLCIESCVDGYSWHYKEELVIEAFEKGFASLLVPTPKKKEPSVPFYDRFEVGDTFKVLHGDVDIANVRVIFEEGTNFIIDRKEGRTNSYSLLTFPTSDFGGGLWCDNDKFEAVLAEGNVVKLEEGCSMSFSETPCEAPAPRTITLDGVDYLLTPKAK